MSINKQKSQKINFILYRLKGMVKQLNGLKESKDFSFSSLRKIYLTVAISYINSLIKEIEDYNKKNRRKK